MIQLQQVLSQICFSKLWPIVQDSIDAETTEEFCSALIK